MICVWGPSCSKYLRRVFGGGGGKVTGARVIRRECRRPLSPWKSPNSQMYKYTCKCISAKPSGRRPMGMITANQSLRCFTKPPSIHSFITKSLGCGKLHFEECHLLLRTIRCDTSSSFVFVLSCFLNQFPTPPSPSLGGVLLISSTKSNICFTHSCAHVRQCDNSQRNSLKYRERGFAHMTPRSGDQSGQVSSQSLRRAEHNSVRSHLFSF